MRKYWAFFKICLKKSLAFRARLLVWFIWDVVPSLMMLFFWLAVFQIQKQVAGYNYASMVIYLFTVMFVRNMVLSHPDFKLEQEIYTGKINTYFLKPVHFFPLKLLSNLSYKVLKLTYLLPTLLFCYLYFLKDQTISFIFSFPNILFFSLSCFLAYLIYFLLKMMIGLTAIWFAEIEWLVGLEELIFWFFGGILLPLDIFPSFMQKISSFLPFKYVLYLPSQIILNRLTPKQIFFNLLIQLFWSVFFIFLSHLIFQRGKKTYSCFGD
jgi:ABC-2 type transport system permease protein